MPVFDMRNQACIVGLGQSQFGRNLDVSPILLQAEAYKAALDDAGLTRDDIDGFSTSHGAPRGSDYDEFAIHTGSNFRWVQQNWTHGRWAGSSVSAAVFAVCAGLANGLLVTWRRVPPFVATFALLIVIDGARLAYTHGQSANSAPGWLAAIGSGAFLGVPIPVLIWLVLLVVLFVALALTPWGRWLYAVGSNRESARHAGIPVNAVILSTFFVTALAA